MFRPLLCLPFILAACGDNITPPFPKSCEIGSDPNDRMVSLWVQDDPDLGMPEAFDGCDLWEPKCLRCVVAADEASAMAKIHVSHDACTLDLSTGGYVLAYSVLGGVVVLKIECLRQLFPHEEDGAINRKALRLVLGHELGHESGMWWHVPDRCDESAAASDFEKDLVRMGVCGKALMNAFLDTRLDAITAFDEAAFDLRDTSHTTFPHVAATETENGCVLTYRPAP